MVVGTKGKLTIAGIFLLVIAAFVLQTVKEESSPESVPPSVELVESRLVGRKDGIKQWEMIARSVLQADGLITLRNLDELFIFQADDSYLTVRADWATWRRREDILELNGPVEVWDEDGFHLESDLLIWEGGEETLTSPGPVLITWDDLIIKAGHMILESETDLLYLSEQVEIKQDNYVFQLENVVYNLDTAVMELYGELELEMEVGGNE